jgi:class 3 adenylate cyclase/pimeloyl-ACP methyl ester carboxylesterase
MSYPLDLRAMVQERPVPGERRLSAILAADVVGYSRLMGTDEEGTLAQLKAHRQTIIDPKITEYRGRIVKTTGDGLLIEFASIMDAMRCAVEVQRTMADINAEVPRDKRFELRIGINVGDIVSDGGDIFGDSVNLAARLESIADRGGICVSRQVIDQIEGKLDLSFRELGRQNLKNIAKPIEVYAVELDAAGSHASRVLAASNLQQQICYCKSPDGVRLAYATVGGGPPLLRSAHWMSHLEYDWGLPIRRSLLHGLAKDYTLIRYDPRGTGLSDWDVGEISFDAWVSDMETVVEAVGLDRFPLLAFSQGCAVSIAYAVRHPERVSQLILYGGFAVGQNKQPNLTAADRERFSTMKTLMRLGWGTDDPTFRQVFTSWQLPAATREQADAYNELQRISASPDSAVRYWETAINIDVRDLLGQVKVPTLVFHVQDDRSVPIALGREIAAGIPGAQFVALPGKNHMLLEQDPGMAPFFRELRSFLRLPTKPQPV